VKHEKPPEEQVPIRYEIRRAFLTSALAGGAFGLIAGVVFLLTGATDASPLPVLGGITLVTANFSGLAGVVGTVLDNFLKTRVSSPPLRTGLIFLAVSVLIFGITLILIKTFGFEAVFPLERYAYLGMFLGLVFGIVFAAVSYRLETIRQKMHLLELENRYLSELAAKDHLLQEAARNLAVAEERNRMARELHDSISQGMHGIVFSLHSLKRRLDGDPNSEEILGHLEATTQSTLQELKRLIMELTPSPLENSSLAEALKLHCELFAQRLQMELNLDIKYEGGLSPEQEEAAYRITQEALSNIQQHAGATRVEQRLTQSENRVTLRIKDNGRGFDPAGHNKGHGLRNMATRARQNGGEFHLESHPGKGTVIKVVFAGEEF
jgi:signal transduction histidine kinase